MEIIFSKSFKKIFRKRIKGSIAEDVFWEKTELFMDDPNHPSLKVHKLSDDLKGLSSFSIEYDMRVVFYFTSETPQKAIFVDIGNHNQVY